MGFPARISYDAQMSAQPWGDDLPQFLYSVWRNVIIPAGSLAGLVAFVRSIFRDRTNLRFDCLIVPCWPEGPDSLNILIRNRSPFPVKVEALGFFYGRFKKTYRMQLSKQPLPYCIEGRSSFSVDLSDGFTLRSDAPRFEGVYGLMATGEVIRKRSPELRRYFTAIGQQRRDGKPLEGRSGVPSGH